MADPTAGYYVEAFGCLYMICDTLEEAKKAKEKFCRDDELEDDERDCVEIHEFIFNQDLSNAQSLTTV